MRDLWLQLKSVPHVGQAIVSEEEALQASLRQRWREEVVQQSLDDLVITVTGTRVWEATCGGGRRSCSILQGHRARREVGEAGRLRVALRPRRVEADERLHEGRKGGSVCVVTEGSRHGGGGTISALVEHPAQDPIFLLRWRKTEIKIGEAPIIYREKL